MVNSEQAAVTDRIERFFARVHRERMAGLPILNPRLAVRLVGPRQWQERWVGVLVTPWTMNLIALPGPRCSDPPGAFGTKRDLDFPAGRCEFITATDPELGPHETCSLFSPMDAFADQADALGVAGTILTRLFEPATAPPAPDPSAARGLSRRGLLRTVLGGGTP